MLMAKVQSHGVSGRIFNLIQNMYLSIKSCVVIYLNEVVTFLSVRKILWRMETEGESN